MMDSYKKKYKLNAKLTNKYCENAYNPTVQPDGKTEWACQSPRPKTLNIPRNTKKKTNNKNSRTICIVREFDFKDDIRFCQNTC